MKNKKIKSNLNFWSIYDFSLGLNDKDLKYKDQILSYLKENEFIDFSSNDFFIKNSIDRYFFCNSKLFESKNDIVKIDSNIFVSYNKNQINEKIDI